MPLCSNVHTHCSYCDGLNTMEEMVQAALSLGFHDIGFSSHSDTGLQEPVLKDIPGYLAEISRLGQKYAGQITITAGVEQDALYPVADPGQFSYLISSVHCLRNRDGKTWIVDHFETFQDCLEEMFGGDAMELVRAFFELSAQSVLTYRPQVVGHLDLVRKYNDGGRYFDETSPAYLDAAKSAIDAIIPTGAIFEINTGGMFRHSKATPYPDIPLLRYIRDQGGRVMVNSDSHELASLAYRFPEALSMAQDAGFSSVWLLRDGVFVEEPISALI